MEPFETDPDETAPLEKVYFGHDDIFSTMVPSLRGVRIGISFAMSIDVGIDTVLKAGGDISSPPRIQELRRSIVCKP